MTHDKLFWKRKTQPQNPWERLTQYKVNVPEGDYGNCSVDKYTVSEKTIQLHGKALGDKKVPKGTYTMLAGKYSGVLMTDLPSSIEARLPIIEKSHGIVLISGLGLGVTAKAVLEKQTVKQVYVIEICPDIINLIGVPLLEEFGPRFNLIRGNIFDWEIPEDIMFDYVWHDIWNVVSKNELEDARVLYQKFQNYALWQSCWITKVHEVQKV